MQGVATVFIANVYGIDLGISGYLTVIAMAVLASIGTAGVPGVGLIMLVTGKALFSLPAFAGAGVLFARIRTFAGLFGMFRAFKRGRNQQNGQQNGQQYGTNTPPPQGQMGRTEAAKTLGVAEKATIEDGKAAHKNLMQRVHPDAGGNDYLAAKLNEARDVMMDGK